MIDSMLDLVIKDLPGGGIELSQFGGRLDDEPDTVRLHRVQIALLAERAGFGVAHTRRLHALRERLGHLQDFYYDEIVDRCGSGIEISLHLEAIGDLVCDLIADIGTAPPAEPVTECHEKSAAISVTPKRGRPAKPDALSPAERQAKHRARQGELLPAVDSAEGDRSAHAEH